jgi:ABC-type glycerol-3-phosphate transport system substrate-binding protein
MSLTKPQLIVVAIAGFIVLVFILVLLGIIPGLQTSEDNPGAIKATLSFWGVGDNREAYADVIAFFKTTYPNVALDYRAFTDAGQYDKAVLEALAAGQGPDIFMVRNTDLSKQANKIVPAPQTQLSAAQFKQYFPQVAGQDFTSDQNVYAIPLSIDTLALVYNRDLFDQAAVPLPTSWQSWEDFAAAISKLKAETEGNDLLYLLMIQNGTKMSNDESGLVSFASPTGVKALNFYFPLYKAGAFDDFSQSKAAMTFAYARDLPGIRSRNSFLKFEVAPMPQPKDAALAVSYPSYWGYAVSRQSRYQALAWSFITSMTFNEAPAKGYVQKTQKPPALNSLIYQYQNDPALGVFAKQALTARSWYQADAEFINETVSGMMNSLARGDLEMRNALDQAQNTINQFVNKR